ncbi:MAG: IS1380 family transposase, partial [Acidimicrobiales bacterium]
TFLRSFTWGHARQLDKVAGELLRRAWAVGAGPADSPVTIDVDSSIHETYGLQKQGGAKFTHTKVRGYHPLYAVIARTGDVVHSRLRGGNANSGRGAAGFLTETFNRVRAAGATGPLTLRADSGFYSGKVAAACRNAGVRYSITVELNKALHKAIAQIPDDAWVPIPYFLDGADVAETTYRPFGKKAPLVRLIVRRVKPTPGSQLALLVDRSYHAFVTDRDGDTLELEADHRRHAVVEDAIRDLKHGVGMRAGGDLCALDRHGPGTHGEHVRRQRQTGTRAWSTSRRVGRNGISTRKSSLKMSLTGCSAPVSCTSAT